MAQCWIGSFNTQPPEGGWVFNVLFFPVLWVSTHSRPKAAGYDHAAQYRRGRVSTHSRPKAAGNLPICLLVSFLVSTHSRPKAAGADGYKVVATREFQHTAARRRLDMPIYVSQVREWFQHTAARRRLVCDSAFACVVQDLFQHTAARRRLGFSF